MTEVDAQSYSQALKLAIVRKMEEGENVSALARLYGISRATLYRWQETLRKDGEAALRNTQSRRAKRKPTTPATGPSRDAAKLEQAYRKIAALERQVAQNQQGIDFLKAVLDHFESRGHNT